MGTIPKYCKDCRNLHTGGRKETKYARWCCKHSRDTQKIWKHCKENGGKVGDTKEKSMGLGYETEHPFDDEPEHPATFTMHTVQGPIHCCVKHARQLESVMRMLGAHTSATKAPDGSVCGNCENEAKAKTANA